MEHIIKFIDQFEKKIGIPQINIIEKYGTNPVVKINNEDYLMFASNNYLSLSNDERVISAAQEALKINGLGPGGSRFLCGNLSILVELEKCISSFIGVDDVITFPTGYMANLAAVSALVGEFIENKPHDIDSALVFSDERNHATIVDGIKISKVNKVIYPHLDYKFLEKELIKHKSNHPKLIITESVYPMDGDIADIKLLVKIAKEYDCMLMIDDAHGVGVLGEKGSGALEYFDVYKDVDIIMGSFDKAMGGMGGYLGGCYKLIKYLRIASRPYIFSSSIPAVMAGGLIKSIEICQLEKNRRTDLLEKANYLRKQLSLLGFKILGSDKIPVLPVLFGKNELCNKVTQYLFKRKIFCPAIIWPAVPVNTARIRLTLMYDHNMEQLNYLLSVFKDIANIFKIK